VFVPFAAVIDPFIDRIYGPNFDLDDPEDRLFLDAVAQFDDAALDLGLVTPTHLIAAFRTSSETVPRYPRNRSPQRMVRDPAAPDPVPAPAPPAAVDPNPELQQQLAIAQTRYETLRNRKVVRAGIYVAEGLKGLLRRRS
jgi:hypothetical protein